jgi:hypothetical protein
MALSRQLVRVVMAVILAVGVGALVATPAAAFPAGLVKVGSSSGATSFDKTWTTACPTGTVVTGGGGYLGAPGGAHLGRLALDRLEPLNNGSGFTSAMKEVFADPLNWQLATDALCMPPPPGWDVISATGPANTQLVSVSCAQFGKHLIGVGGRINNGQGSVILDRVVPMPDMQTVQVRGTPVPGKVPPAVWSVTAFAVCAFPDVAVRTSFSAPAGSPASVSMNWSCPAGMGLLSVGADISPGTGNVFLEVVHAIDTDSFSLRAAERLGGFPGMWVATTWGICSP